MKFITRLLKLLLPYSTQVLFSVILGVATVVSGIGLLGTSAYLIAAAALHPDISSLQVAIVGVRFFGLSRAVFRYLERLVSHSVNFKLLAGLRVWYFRVIEPLAPARLDEYNSGDLLHRVTADIDYLENFYIRVVSPPIVALVVTIGMSLFLGTYSPGLGLILSAGLLSGGFAIPLLSYFANRYSGAKLVEVRAGLSETILDGIQGTADIELFNQGKWYIKKIQSITGVYGSIQKKLFWMRGLTDGLNILITNLTLFFILLTAIPSVAENRINGISLAVICLVTLASFEAVTPLGIAAQFLEGSLKSGSRLLTLENLDPAVAETKGGGLEPAGNSLEVCNISFHYDESSPEALSNVSFTAQEGMKLAIVGPNGSGKSSLINLLMRFWDYQEGDIYLGGVSLRDLSAAKIHAAFSLVSPSTYIFNDSVRNNLLLANPVATDADMQAVLKDVRLDKWLGSLPVGFDTWLGEFGVRMSGGERQRLAMARALIRNTPILLLDEPTSNLDLSTAKDIIEIIHGQTQGKTVIWISHSLAGMDKMDNIIVLENGNAIEQGNHRELLSMRNKYSRMWELYSGTILNS